VNDSDCVVVVCVSVFIEPLLVFLWGLFGFFGSKAFSKYLKFFGLNSSFSINQVSFFLLFPKYGGFGLFHV